VAEEQMNPEAVAHRSTKVKLSGLRVQDKPCARQFKTLNIFHIALLHTFDAVFIQSI